MYFLIVLQSLKVGGLLRNSVVTCYVLFNNFFCVLLSFVFHLQKDFCGVQDDTGAFFSFCFSKRFWNFRESFFSFYLLFFRNILDSVFLFIINFFIRIFFVRIFFPRILFIRFIRRNFYIFIIYIGFFFSLAT